MNFFRKNCAHCFFLDKPMTIERLLVFCSEIREHRSDKDYRRAED